MQKELQLALLVIGGLFIVGILAHGFWTTRKQQKRNSPNQYESRRNWEPKISQEDDDDTEYEDVIISPARVVRDPNNSDKLNISDAEITSDNSEDLTQNLNDQPESIHQSGASQTEEDTVNESDDHAIEEEPEKPLYSGVVTQPKPEFTRASKDNKDTSIPEPPSFLLRNGSTEGVKQAIPSIREYSQDPEPSKAKQPHESANPPVEPKVQSTEDVELQAQLAVSGSSDTKTSEPEEKELSFADHAKRLVRRRRKSLAEKIRKEPVLGTGSKNDDQMRIDFGESAESTDASDIDEPRVASGPDEPQQQDVLILNVQTSQDSPIAGASLLPMLLTLGFKFGEHDIFHRHVNTNGKGPILFSLANMFKPGIFDIDNMETFTTQGVSLFMMLPIDGEPQQVFNMMHNAARKIADEFGGKILDANKVPISKQSLQQYAERIRDFERRRLSR